MTTNTHEERKIDHSIDVRYEPDVLIAFNKFIKKWCGKYYAHLVDDDENDGQFMREKIAHAKQEGKKEGIREVILDLWKSARVSADSIIWIDEESFMKRLLDWRDKLDSLSPQSKGKEI